MRIICFSIVSTAWKMNGSEIYRIIYKVYHKFRVADKTDRLLNYLRYIRPVERSVGVVAIIVQYVRGPRIFRVVLFKKASPGSCAKPSIIRSPDKSRRGVRAPCVWRIYQGFLASSPRARTSPSSFSTCFFLPARLPACAADFRISRDCRCDSGADERTDKSRDFSFGRVTLNERCRLSLSEKQYVNN